MLERVDGLVLQGRLVKRGIVGEPHHGGEQGPGEEGKRQDAHDRSVQHRQQGAADAAGSGSAGEEDGFSPEQQRRRDHRQKEVLRHVHREQDVRVAADAGAEREADGEEAAKERCRAAEGEARGRMRGVVAVHGEEIDGRHPEDGR